MGEDTKFIFNKLSFSLPEDWYEHSDVADPHTKQFAINTQSGSVKLTTKEVDPSQAMPYGQDQAVIDIIHKQFVDDESGLIEVATIDNGDLHSVHTVFKRQVNDPANPMLKLFYTASLYVHTSAGKVYAFLFQGQEEGMTGMRDAQVFAQAQSQGAVTIASGPETGQPKMQGWQQDPYDSSFTKGFLMNQSEKAEYDNAFPQHPLSLLRTAIKTVSQTASEGN